MTAHRHIPQPDSPLCLECGRGEDEHESAAVQLVAAAERLISRSPRTWATRIAEAYLTARHELADAREEIERLRHAMTRPIGRDADIGMHGPEWQTEFRGRLADSTCGEKPVLLPIPDGLDVDFDPKHPEYGLDEHGRRCFKIDACIAPAVEALWAIGVKTLGCCCGHGTGHAVVSFLTDCRIEPTPTRLDAAREEIGRLNLRIEEVRQDVPCPDCGGLGGGPGAAPFGGHCQTCNGKAYLPDRAKLERVRAYCREHEELVWCQDVLAIIDGEDAR